MNLKIVEKLLNRLSQREKRMLKFGVFCAVAIVVFVFGAQWLEHRGQVKNSLNQMKARLKDIALDDAKQAGLMSIVPAFEMPQIEENQKYLFMEKFNEQLRKAGVLQRSEPLQALPAGKSAPAGYKLLRLKCSAKCGLTQVLDLLANLKENPYLVGVEEMRIQCDPKKRQEVDLDLTVSTFVK